MLGVFGVLGLSDLLKNVKYKTTPIATITITNKINKIGFNFFFLGFSSVISLLLLMLSLSSVTFFSTNVSVFIVSSGFKGLTIFNSCWLFEVGETLRLG